MLKTHRDVVGVRLDGKGVDNVFNSRIPSGGHRVGGFARARSMSMQIDV